MTDVIIAGVGQTPVSEAWEVSLRDLVLQAIEAARADSCGLVPQALFVGNMLAPAISRQAHLGSLIADYSGLRGIEAATIESAGASGGAALRMGVMAVASGEADVVLVAGVEKNTDQIGSATEAAHATTTDSDWEAVHGLTPTTQAALLMSRYLYEYSVPHSAFANFSVTAHANAATNPNAMYRMQLTAEAYNESSIVSSPLNMMDMASNADGAAAVILTRADLLPPGFPHKLVRVSGSSAVTDTLALHDRPNLLSFEAARLSVEKACRQAGIHPGDVDLFELYDAFTIYAALSLEAAGFAGTGKGWELAQNGSIGLNGLIPISTFGGLKGRGNAGGATGLYQAVEAALQLRGQAGKNQVPNAQRAMIQCLGGPASTVATHILEAIES